MSEPCEACGGSGEVQGPTVPPGPTCPVCGRPRALAVDAQVTALVRDFLADAETPVDGPAAVLARVPVRSLNLRAGESEGPAAEAAPTGEYSGVRGRVDETHAPRRRVARAKLPAPTSQLRPVHLTGPPEAAASGAAKRKPAMRVISFPANFGGRRRRGPQPTAPELVTPPPRPRPVHAPPPPPTPTPAPERTPAAPSVQAAPRARAASRLHGPLLFVGLALGGLGSTFWDPFEPSLLEASTPAVPPSLPASAPSTPPSTPPAFNALSTDLEVLELRVEKLPEAAVVRGVLHNTADSVRAATTLEATLSIDGVPHRRRVVPCCDALEGELAAEVAQNPRHPHLRAGGQAPPTVELEAGERRPFAVVFPALGPSSVTAVLTATVRPTPMRRAQ